MANPIPFEIVYKCLGCGGVLRVFQVYSGARIPSARQVADKHRGKCPYCGRCLHQKPKVTMKALRG